jgi:hypothetical protein
MNIGVVYVVKIALMHQISMEEIKNKINMGLQTLISAWEQRAQLILFTEIRCKQPCFPLSQA